MDLVVASLEAWDTVWRRNQHLVSRLLRDDPALRVLFVEPAADPLHDLASRRRARWGSPVSVVPGYGDRLMSFRPLKLLPRRLDRRADKRMARQIIGAAVSARMRRPVLWANDPGAATLARISGWPALYDITDDWAVAERSPGELERVRTDEDWLLTRARAVVACSAELVRRKRAARGTGTIELIPNAVDAVAYRTPTDRPADLPAVAAVYVGTLHRDRLDVDLCVRTAREIAERAALVLVGPNALSREDTQTLLDAGIVLLGPRPHEQVIAYLQHADVLLVPHVVTDFTNSLDPIKLYEYGAVGRPVVATPVAGFRDAAASVQLAEGEQFARAVGSLIPAMNRFPEGADAPVATWDDRAAAMRAVIAAINREDDRA